MVQGKVLRQLDPGHFSLQFGDRPLVVESSVPLPLSTDLLFRVEETGDRTLLKWVPPEDGGEQTTASFLKRALAADVPLDRLAGELSNLEAAEWIPAGGKESWKQFLRLFSQFTPAELMARGPQLLARLFFQSGFFWESKVRGWIEGERKDLPEQLVEEDLKGLGLKLLAHLRGASDSSDPDSRDFLKAEALEKNLESFLQKIELHQILNLRGPDPPDRFHLFLPFWMGSQLQFVEFDLSLSSNRNQRGGGNGFSVLFLLNLPEFGPVRIEVRLEAKALFCGFRVANEEISEFLRRGIPLLQEGLEKMGFQPSIRMTAGPMDGDSGPLLGEKSGGSQALLSIVI
jgi:hypothetical protein